MLYSLEYHNPYPLKAMQTTQQDSYLQQSIDTLNNEEFINLVKLLFSTLWAVVIILSQAIYLLGKQVYVWGQLAKAHYAPTITKIKNQLHLATINQNNPVANFIQGYLKAEVIQLTQTESNDSTTIDSNSTQSEVKILVGNESATRHKIAD